MDKFRTLEPVKLYAAGKKDPKPPQVSIGRLPSNIHLLILAYVPIPDLPAYARSCRATSAFIRDDSTWATRWKTLLVDGDAAFQRVLDDLEQKANEQATIARTKGPPTIPVDDDFGDFADADILSQPQGEMADFVGAFSVSTAVHPRSPPSSTPAKDRYKVKFIRAFNLLRPLTRLLSSPPHLVLSELSQHLPPSLNQQAKLLRLLARFLSPSLQPIRQWESLYVSLRSAMDRYDSTLLGAFDVADGNGDESAMREAAQASWEMISDNNTIGDWEMGKVWAEKREIFYQHGKWKALDNFTKEEQLDFRAMDEFMEDIVAAINDHGARAVRVFPPASQVLLLFSDRLANEVIGEYITTLLSHARQISTTTYLKSVAASFREAWRMVDAIMDVARQRPDSQIIKMMAEDVVYRMFEPNLDEYLDEELDNVKHAFDTTCKNWNKNTSSSLSSPYNQATATTQFLTSELNPALVKRNVLASFTNMLLLPVTIVPRTVGAVVGGALVTGGTAAVQGMAMLNPQRWTGNNAPPADNIRYSRNLHGHDEAGTVWDIEDEDGAAITESPDVSHPNRTSPDTADAAERLDLLLSLDVAIELIHADREALKRVETFAGYPGHYGHQVRDTIEEIFVSMLQALGDKHMANGFSLAIDRMKSYKPAEHAEVANVAPLVQFFELVHLGDTIQSMVQVYFDKAFAYHIDKTDFLNGVMREKKRFESSLDDSVAFGLNTGTELLMNQVEHIIITLTQAREYYPPEGSPLDLKPTRGCLAVIQCLEKHCKLLKESTTKEVLEVFYQEIGLRLIGILQKHIKRQIISLNGGFQIIADLNAYNAFILSLKNPSLIADFSNLKMLGHVYIVEDAKDLAQIVRDVTRYGGAYRPEDIYEFIQRRSDWKKIEKVVDKTMYNLSFKEDCTIF